MLQTTGSTLSCGDWLVAGAGLARLDAELLAAHVLGVGRAGVLAHPETMLTPTQVHRLDELSRRCKLEPLAYILGHKEFYALNFRVGPAVLVPRPETELLVELAVALTPRNGRLADLGTGSGCIAVAIKTHRPDLGVIATDISCAALAVAAVNAVANRTQIALARADWLAPLRGPFDCIVANPPYIGCQDAALKSLRGEPRRALCAGGDGLDAIHRIVAEAPDRLAPGARLILEHGCTQGDAVRATLARYGFQDIQTHKDLAGLDRATVAQAP